MFSAILLLFSASVLGNAFSTPLRRDTIVCLNFDNDNSPLISSGLSQDGQILSCIYDDQQLCTYEALDGGFDSGSSICPQSITPSTSTLVCNLDNNNSPLIDNTQDSGVLACLYADGQLCEYEAADGSFSEGSSACPSLLESGSASGPTPAGDISKGGSAAALLSDNSSSNRPASDTKTISMPILIALLAMNGALVLAVLAIGCFWVFGRRSGPTRLGLNAGSGLGYKTVPFTHGSDDSHYYDAQRRNSSQC
ncbi:hypothetical protein DFH07DRAFT_957317 [Mycena maculata]|uniref:Uncharacterized protein n=1 Tax=Mycena maculata TaxID=230809 RepID=A0AAD7JCZ8_9AGAR|nr:hypothetical protein DFH07DRAFT_957317 [Mycena maculata]